MRAALAIGAAALALAVAGCGHTVKPTEAFRDPASLPVGAEVTARQEPGAVVLSWTADGDAYQTLDGWNVYRRDVMDGPATRLNAALVADLTYRDTTVAEGAEYFYSVRGVSGAGVEGRGTHELVIRYDSVAPAAPQGVTATAEQNAVLLAWKPSPAADWAEYRVYRDGMLLAARVREPLYRDAPVGSEQAHRYRVTAVDATGNESAPSSEILIASLPAADTTPPPVPSGLTASADGERVRVAWNAVADAALLGYVVYRRADGEPAWTHAPGSTVTPLTEYRDAEVTNGVTYEYAVSAVDSSGNESARSAAAAIRWVARAIDTGGTTLGSVYPWCGVVSNSGRMHFLLPAADLARGGTIDSLFLWILSGSAIYDNVTVRLAHTQATALTGFFAQNETAAAEPLRTVFGPATINSTLARQGSLLPLALQTPFAYDGARNLLVEMSWNGDNGRTVVFGFRAEEGGKSLRLWQQPNGAADGVLEANQQFLRVTFASAP